MGISANRVKFLTTDKAIKVQDFTKLTNSDVISTIVTPLLTDDAISAAIDALNLLNNLQFSFGNLISSFDNLNAGNIAANILAQLGANVDKLGTLGSVLRALQSADPAIANQFLKSLVARVSGTLFDNPGLLSEFNDISTDMSIQIILSALREFNATTVNGGIAAVNTINQAVGRIEVESTFLSSADIKTVLGTTLKMTNTYTGVATGLSGTSQSQPNGTQTSTVQTASATDTDIFLLYKILYKSFVLYRSSHLYNTSSTNFRLYLQKPVENTSIRVISLHETDPYFAENRVAVSELYTWTMWDSANEMINSFGLFTDENVLLDRFQDIVSDLSRFIKEVFDATTINPVTFQKLTTDLTADIATYLPGKTLIKSNTNMNVSDRVAFRTILARLVKNLKVYGNTPVTDDLLVHCHFLTTYFVMLRRIEDAKALVAENNFTLVACRKTFFQFTDTYTPAESIECATNMWTTASCVGGTLGSVVGIQGIGFIDQTLLTRFPFTYWPPVDNSGVYHKYFYEDFVKCCFILSNALRQSLSAIPSTVGFSSYDASLLAELNKARTALRKPPTGYTQGTVEYMFLQREYDYYTSPTKLTTDTVALSALFDDTVNGSSNMGSFAGLFGFPLPNQAHIPIPRSDKANNYIRRLSAVIFDSTSKRFYISPV